MNSRQPVEKPYNPSVAADSALVGATPRQSGESPLGLPDVAIDAALDFLVVDLLAGSLVLEHTCEFGCESWPPYLAVSRQWLSLAVCHPASFRRPLEEWCAFACSRLDEQLSRLEDPPEDLPMDAHEGFSMSLAHAEEELRVTELSASFPSGVTVLLVRYLRQLITLLNWVRVTTCVERKTIQHSRFDSSGEALLGSVVPDATSLPSHATSSLLEINNLCDDEDPSGSCPCHRECEVVELRRRIALLLQAGHSFECRLPDPELPMRWAAWSDGMVRASNSAVQGEYSARYRKQREQTAAVWANNRRTLLCTIEHIDALAASLHNLEVASQEACAGT